VDSAAELDDRSIINWLNPGKLMRRRQILSKAKILYFVISLFLFLSLSLSFFSPVVAASQSSPITLEQAMTIAKQKLSIPDNYSPSMSFYSNYSDTEIPVWSIYYSDGTQEYGHNIIA